MNRFRVGVVCLIAISARPLLADEGKLVATQQVPAGVSEKIAATLNPAGQQVVIDGKAVCTIWLTRALSIKPDFKPSLSIKYPLAQGQLVGVMEVVKKSEFTDFRGQDVAVGVYTLRYGQQPVDGNHVGTSDLSDFLLALPARADVDPASPANLEALFKLSATTTGSNHPAIYSLLPPKADDKTPSLTHEKEFWVIRLTADGKSAAGAVKVPLRLVIIGVSEG